MPSYIVKATDEDDWYCIWSTVVDSPTWWGTKAELQSAAAWKHDVTDERFNRADRYGTSAMWGGPDFLFGWNDVEFILMESAPERTADGCWLLPRVNLRAACESLDENECVPVNLLRWESDR